MTTTTDVITAEQAARLLVDAVSTPSISGDESDLASLLHSFAAKHGAESWIDEVGNVHARVGPERPPVMLVSHLDTVGGEVPFRVTDELVAGRGSVDAKGALIAMLVAVLNLRASDLALHWVGAVGEETVESQGAEHLRETCGVPAALIVGEPSGSSSVTIGYKGKVDFSYHVDVPEAHTATPHDKAAEVAVRFLSDLSAVYSSDGNAQFKQVGLTVRDGSLQPDHSECVLSFRVPPDFSTDELHSELDTLAGDAGRVALINSVQAVVVPRTDPVVAHLSAAIAGRGLRPRHVLKTGTSDMNTLAQSWTVPMATYGPGDCRLDHSATEHLPFDEFQLSVQVLQDALGPISVATCDAGLR